MGAVSIMQLQRIVSGVAIVAAASLAFAGAAGAGVITSASGYAVGIGENGELFDANAGVGFQRADGFDPIAPGVPRDSWGVSVAGLGGAYADGVFTGSTVLGTTFAYGSDSAHAVTDTGLGLTVTQDYSFVGDGNILKIVTTVRNDGAGPVDALFQRLVDFDIDFGLGENVVGPFGVFPGVVDASYFGFESANPADGPFQISCATGCNQTNDLGVGIRISLGSLASGATKRFAYYYGLNVAGQTLNDLVAQGHAAGASYLLGAQGPENGDYPSLGVNSAVMGVGSVPEPATWAMLILGFFGLGAALRRRGALAA